MQNAVTETKEMDEKELAELIADQKKLNEEADFSAVQDSGETEPEKEKKKFDYTVKLSGRYEFNGKEYTELDLNGLEDMTTRTGEKVDRIMAKLGHYPRVRYQDTLYCKHVAAEASGIPIDFFNMLKLKDMEEVKNIVGIYFLIG